MIALTRKRLGRAGMLKRIAQLKERREVPAACVNRLTPQQQALVDNFDGEFHHGDVVGIDRDERERLGFHRSIMDVHIPQKGRRRRVGSDPAR